MNFMLKQNRILLNNSKFTSINLLNLKSNITNIITRNFSSIVKTQWPISNFLHSHNKKFSEKRNEKSLTKLYEYRNGDVLIHTFKVIIREK